MKVQIHGQISFFLATYIVSHCNTLMLFSLLCLTCLPKESKAAHNNDHNHKRRTSTVVKNKQYSVGAFSLGSCMTIKSERNSPEAFIKKLQDAETRSKGEVECRFVFSLLKSAVEKHMKKMSCAQFSDYYFSLASSKKLSDKDKLARRFVMIPHWKEFQQRPQKEKDVAFKKLITSDSDIHTSAMYAFARILYAAFCYTGANPDSYKYLYSRPLVRSLLHSDVPLTERLLQHKADPNIIECFGAGRTLLDVKTLAEARLLLKHGADIRLQQQKWFPTDFVANKCTICGSDSDPRIIALYLDELKKAPNKECYENLEKYYDYFSPKNATQIQSILQKYTKKYSR